MILNAISVGEGKPVLLLHGLFGQARNFASLQRKLAASHRVIALDLRNHGGSPHAAGMDYRTLAADVLETMTALGLNACPIVGHSMGGKTAMAAALLAPARVTKLVVVDIAPVAYGAHFGAIVAAMQGMELGLSLTRASADTALAMAEPDPATRKFLLSNLHLGAAPGWRIGLGNIAAGMADISDWPFADESYAGPVLFVIGGLSRYVRPEHRAAIAAHFPRARFVTLKKAGHWVHADDPEAVLDVLRAAL